MPFHLSLFPTVCNIGSTCSTDVELVSPWLSGRFWAFSIYPSRYLKSIWSVLQPLRLQLTYLLYLLSTNAGYAKSNYFRGVGPRSQKIISKNQNSQNSVLLFVNWLQRSKKFSVCLYVCFLMFVMRPILIIFFVEKVLYSEDSPT